MSTPTRKASQKPASRAKRRKALLGAIAEVSSQRVKGGQRCKTCLNAGWVETIQDFLDSMIEGELDPLTPLRYLYVTFTTKAAELGIDEYELSETSFKHHIQSCEKERYGAVETAQAKADS